jgi:hypothetical protein
MLVVVSEEVVDPVVRSTRHMKMSKLASVT